jgi:chemotaxis protein CheX
MKVEFINPFLASAISAFDTMLGCPLTRGTPYAKNGSSPEHEVSGVIGLSGAARGTVVLGLSRAAAINAAEVLLQERPPEINADVTDAIGELANIIAGGAKARLAHLEMSVGLPMVITGKCHCVEFPSKVTPLCIPFESQWGPITVEVGLTDPDEQPQSASAQQEQCSC